MSKAKPTKRIAPQYLFTGFGSTQEALRYSLMVIPEEDKRFLVDPPASAFVFIVPKKESWTVRIASEYFIQDVQVKSQEPLKVLKETLKILKENCFETASIITEDEYLHETINGGEGLDDDTWTVERVKANKQCVNQQVSASTASTWHKRHIKQMKSAKDVTIKTQRMEIFV